MKNVKPSDFNAFCVTVFNASATLMDFDQFMEIYDEILRLVFWNPHIDTPIAISQNPNPSGVVLKGGFHG